MTVNISDVRVYLGEAVSGGLSPSFESNRISVSPVLEADRISLSTDENGMAILELAEPWKYEGGDLLIELFFGRVSGSIYTFGWTSGEERYLSSSNLRAESGRLSETIPVVTLITR